MEEDRSAFKILTSKPTKKKKGKSSQDIRMDLREPPSSWSELVFSCYLSSSFTLPIELPLI